MKDRFSTHSKEYARYRPHFPREVFQFIQKTMGVSHRAWDCGTGNGQVARELARFFKEVYATDIRRQQLQNAIERPNIFYSCQAAESTRK